MNVFDAENQAKEILNPKVEEYSKHSEDSKVTH
jgi:hypothetical protein